MINLKGTTKALTNDSRELYFKAFGIAFLIMMGIFLPSMVYNKGIFLYYGDFNSQQIHFYTHAHEMIKSGNLFWDWGTDLGANFIGSYSFYLLGSPFFWLTIPFPTAAVPYLIPWLLALKTGVAAVTAYAFIRRFVQSKNAALIGSILYALSGFQIYNVFFNHFHEPVVFFPLLLLALEMAVVDNKKGLFAGAVAICAFTNYFFFTGQVVFLFIYFMCRCTSKDFTITFKKFIMLGIEAVIGVMLSAVLLLPSVLSVFSNPRVDSQLTGLDMVVYSDKFRIFRIIQSFFMIPDPPARSNLFSSTTARWASIAGYLPMFSMAGVIAFIKGKKKHWASKAVIACIVCALVPVLNSAFYMFNSSYYARWYYMPVLLMCMMTAYALDHKELSFNSGIKISVIVVLICAAIGLLPSIDSDTKLTVYAKVAKYPELFWPSVGITLLCLGLLFHLVLKTPDKRYYFKKALNLTVLSAFMCSALIVWYGIAQGPEHQDKYISQAINGADSISLEEDDEFYRIDISENKDNYPMSWGMSSMRAFHSVVPSSIMTFYEGIGITRDVASRAETSRYPLRGLFSVKYYFNYITEEELDMPGFVYYDTQNEFNIYVNECYIPMGFTYDYYITQENFDKYSGVEKDMLLLKAVVLTNEQIAEYRDILEPLSDDECVGLYSDELYMRLCDEKKESAAYYFEEGTKGFTAKISLESEKLVFFSVPYEKGFTATVNGVLTQIEEVDGGMMAVRCPAGESVEIRFDYMTPGLKNGVIISLAGILILAAYVLIRKKLEPEAAARPVEYDYESFEAAIDNGEYDIPDEKAENEDNSDNAEQIYLEDLTDENFKNSGGDED
ncbi:MAG: YfhO family protein [Oscillospiraceae bacterium]|jgi:uncharacterized membrane protein YfhO